MPSCRLTTDPVPKSDPAIPVCSSSGAESKILLWRVSTSDSCWSRVPWRNGLPWTCTRRQPCWNGERGVQAEGSLRGSWRLLMTGWWRQRWCPRQRCWMTLNRYWQVSKKKDLWVSGCAYVRVRACLGMRTRVRACVHACVRACVCVLRKMILRWCLLKWPFSVVATTLLPSTASLLWALSTSFTSN